MQLSIIIPTYNEEKGVSKLLKHLQYAISGKVNYEIIIIDGGSTDNTIVEIENVSKELDLNVTPYVSLKKGRAVQMNYGAAKATGKYFYFLHADTFPPQNFDETILEFSKDDVQAGSFRMKFDKSSMFFNFWSWFTRFTWDVASGGDQSLFVSNMLFKSLNGFDDKWSIMEDVDIVIRIKKNANYRVIPQSVITSTRKYDEVGLVKLQYVFVSLQVQRIIGKSPIQLYAYYHKKLSQ